MTPADVTAVADLEDDLLDLARRVPLATLPLTIGERMWRVTGVHDQDQLLDAAESFDDIPYGCLIWDSSIALARHIAEQPQLVRGVRVLELGAGTGLAGLVAAACDARVCQTDHLGEALSLAAFNARQNGIAAPKSLLADWRDWQHAELYDVIIGADILYSLEAAPYLVPILTRNLAPSGRVILADPSRPQALDLIARLEDAGWRFTISMKAPANAASGNAAVAILSGTPPLDR
jgi:predicted nicotinamide N-methyase